MPTDTHQTRAARALSGLMHVGHSAGGHDERCHVCVALAAVENEIESATDRMAERVAETVKVAAKLGTCLVDLRCAITKHRDEKADDRCWMSDYELYAALGEPITPSACHLDDPDTMLANCRRFIASRHDPAKPYLSPQKEIDRLTAERERLRAALKPFANFAAATTYLRPQYRLLPEPPPGAGAVIGHHPTVADCRRAADVLEEESTNAI